jgi:hypothetical protein
MHYNYASLKHAFELLNCEWGNLYKASNDNYNKINLVWRQLIGYEMRRLPGIDRCVMAQGLYYVIEDKAPVARTYSMKYRQVSCPTFPVTVADDSIDGLGENFAINIFGLDALAVGGKMLGGEDSWRDWQYLETYVEQKLQTCRTYAASPNSAAEPVCNNLSC